MAGSSSAKGKRKREHQHHEHEHKQEEDDEEPGGEGKHKEEEAVNGSTELQMEIAGIPPQPSTQKAEGGVIFILEKASLEVAKVGKTYQLLNCDDHAHFLRKHKHDPAAYRPDIIHQALLAVLDSPLNKAGRLITAYVQTEKNVLIQVNPHIRLPRTIKRFSGLMVQLLQKLSIRATNGPDKLLRVIKSPVTKHLPIAARRIGLSHSAPKVVQLHEYIAAASDKSPLVFVVGAMAHGKINADYIDDLVSIQRSLLMDHVVADQKLASIFRISSQCCMLHRTHLQCC